MSELDHTYLQSPECLVEDMDGESLLFHPASATTLHLNQPSLVVWQLCDGETSVADIITALSEAFPDQSAQIEQDVLAVIEDLSARKVLTKVA